jgi:predicted unusual protein kinase regulating ubiquinone biosynthesis (AarF/ABC1/UbiB family)
MHRPIRSTLGAATALAAAGLVGVGVGRTIGAAVDRRRGVRKAPARTRVSAPPVALDATDRLTRSARLAGLGLRSGGGYAVHRVQRAVASGERRTDLDEAFQLRTAEQVTEALGHMKGALMKLGQMASYLDPGLPEPVRDALSQLQASAPPMAPELAADVIEAELGEPPDRAFASWDEIPLAAASIGQVHRATTHDGREVAVKVQYPGVDAAIRADLGNAGILFQAIGLLFPNLEPGPLVAEIRGRLLEELDYVLEADNQRLFSEYYAGHPFIHIPEVVGERSTARVLTTELATGERFDGLLGQDQRERDLAGEAIYRFVFRSLYRLHAFNGDPHPGNYLFDGQGRVTFLDFGLVKRFTADELHLFGEMVQAIVIHRDIPRYRAILERVGLLAPGQPFSDHEIEAYFGHFYELVLDPGPLTVTPQYSSEMIRRYFDATGPYGEIMKQANLPSEFVIIQRINLGLYAVLGDLRATADWRAVTDELWPFVNAPASTPLGELEAEWLASRAVSDPA